MKNNSILTKIIHLAIIKSFCLQTTTSSSIFINERSFAPKISVILNESRSTSSSSSFLSLAPELCVKILCIFVLFYRGLLGILIWKINSVMHTIE